jgi:hypothetical protein
MRHFQTVWARALISFIVLGTLFGIVLAYSWLLEMVASQSDVDKLLTDHRVLSNLNGLLFLLLILLCLINDSLHHASSHLVELLKL